MITRLQIGQLTAFVHFKNLVLTQTYTIILLKNLNKYIQIKNEIFNSN